MYGFRNMKWRVRGSQEQGGMETRQREVLSGKAGCFDGAEAPKIGTVLRLERAVEHRAKSER